MKKSKIILFMLVFCAVSAHAEASELESAIAVAKANCSGISAELQKMQTIAGVNTAVTGVGTLAGAGAVATGFVKQSKDRAAGELEQKLNQLKNAETGGEKYEALICSEDFTKRLEAYVKEQAEKSDGYLSEKNKLDEQSKKLGNARTGLMAGNTATNIAGAAIAGTNKVSENLAGRIGACKAAAGNVRTKWNHARQEEGADKGMLARADKIASACDKFNLEQVGKINSRATGAMWSGIAGAGIGAAGTITSATANSDSVRGDKTADGADKAIKINTASNIMAIGAVGASLAGTIFNATQIKAVNDALKAAKECEEELK